MRPKPIAEFLKPSISNKNIKAIPKSCITVTTWAAVKALLKNDDITMQYEYVAKRSKKNKMNIV